MSDTEDTGDVSNFQRPTIHENEVSILMELIFGGWDPDNEVAELYDSFDKEEILSMIETFKDPEVWIDGLMKSQVLKNMVLNEIHQHVGSLKFVVKKYYSGKKPVRKRLRYDDEGNELEDDEDE